MQMSDEEKRCLFLQVPDISLQFPIALKYDNLIILLQAETCDEAQNKKRNYKQNNNRIMGYFIITDSNWARLRDEILNLAQTCHKPFSQIGHKCYYRREDVERLLQTKSEKPKTDKSKNNK